MDRVSHLADESSVVIEREVARILLALYYATHTPNDVADVSHRAPDQDQTAGLVLDVVVVAAGGCVGPWILSGFVERPGGTSTLQSLLNLEVPVAIKPSDVPAAWRRQPIVLKHVLTGGEYTAQVPSGGPKGQVVGEAPQRPLVAQLEGASARGSVPLGVQRGLRLLPYEILEMGRGIPEELELGARLAGDEILMVIVPRRGISSPLLHGARRWDPKDLNLLDTEIVVSP